MAIAIGMKYNGYTNNMNWGSGLKYYNKYKLGITLESVPNDNKNV